MGRICPKATVLALTTLLTLTSAGCEFFGKQTAETSVRAPGELPDGTSIVGTWTVSSASTSPQGTPDYAMTSTYAFDPTGVARIELRDPRGSGLQCTGYGQYRIVGNRDVVVYIQAASPTSCGFNSQIHLADVTVKSQSIRFTDPDTGYAYSYFTSRPQPAAPVGVWDFDSAGGVGGEGGIDYLFLDSGGYFILQTTDAGAQYLLMGSYTVSGGQLRLDFFANMDPSQVVGSPMVFTQFVTDGEVLELVETIDGVDYLSVGRRL